MHDESKLTAASFVAYRKFYFTVNVRAGEIML